MQGYLLRHSDSSSTGALYATPLSGAERPPRRLPDLSLGSLQPQSSQAIGGDGRQRAATAFALRINECSAVRGETRRFIEMPVRQHPHGAAREILERDAVVAVVERHHRQLRAIRRDPRPGVVVTAEGETLGTCARIHADLIDLRGAGAF